jgi:hypothetical protein
MWTAADDVALEPLARSAADAPGITGAGLYRPFGEEVL